MIPLRPYQSEGLDAIRAELRKSPSILYVLPTGGGKTVLFATMAAGAAAKRNSVLILVHRKEILEQTLSSLFRLGVTAGQVAAGRPETLDYIQVGMVQTVARRLHRMRRPDLIITDEAHHVLADNSYGAVLKYWRDVPVVGFTATPERLDGRGLCENFATMIQGPSIRSLVEGGYLSPPVLYRPPSDLLGNQVYHVTRGDFDAAEQEAAQDTKTRRGRRIVGDVIDHYRQHLDRLPVVVFCVSIRHAHAVAEEFKAAGYQARAVWGNMDRKDRDDAIGGLASGKWHVITSCDLISEGVDVPVMAGAILLRRTMSLGLYLQQAGRALRLCEGKSRAVILDHAGNYQIHGHVLSDRTWSLDARARGERGEEKPTTTVCPSCYGVWPGCPRACPDCGYDFVQMRLDAERKEEIRVIAGELVEAGFDDGGDLAALYRDAMSKPLVERSKMLAIRGIQELQKVARHDGSPTAEAWRWRANI